MDFLVNMFKLSFAVCIFLLFSSMSGCEKTEDDVDNCVLTEWDEEVRYKVFPRLKFRGTGVIDIKEADTMYLIANFYKWDCGVDPPESTYVTHELFVYPKQMTNDEFYKDFVIAPEYFYFDNDMDYVTFELTFTVFANGINCGCTVPMRYGFPAEFEDYYSKDVADRDDPRYLYYDVYIDMGNLEYNCDGTP